jgi:hypothetical protein
VFGKFAEAIVEAAHLEGERSYLAVGFIQNPVDFFPLPVLFFLSPVLFFFSPGIFFFSLFLSPVVFFLSPGIVLPAFHDGGPNLFKGDAAGVVGFRRWRRGSTF